MFFDTGIYRLKASLRLPLCIKTNRKQNAIDTRSLTIVYKHSKFENFIASNTINCKAELNPIAYDSDRPIAVPHKKVNVSDEVLEEIRLKLENMLQTTVKLKIGTEPVFIPAKEYNCPVCTNKH